jgi:hypothetical protein
MFAAMQGESHREQNPTHPKRLPPGNVQGESHRDHAPAGSLEWNYG